MDNVGKSENSPAFNPPMDDIPVAVRDHAPASPRGRINKPVLLAGLTGIAVIALATGSLVSLQLRQIRNVTLATETSSTSASPNPMVSPAASSTDVMLKHFSYAEASRSELVTVVNAPGILLRKAAAEQFRNMIAAAEQSGVSLVPLSGFRSKIDQDELFFKIKAERGQSPSERAKVSAPPGYSEHHTGYAIDIGDANVPATNLSQSFEKTEAFRWLQKNAAHFSFELSFPKNNPQGVDYEPWHWRFVGDRTSLETFYKARSINR